MQLVGQIDTSCMLNLTPMYDRSMNFVCKSIQVVCWTLHRCRTDRWTLYANRYKLYAEPYIDVWQVDELCMQIDISCMLNLTPMYDRLMNFVCKLIQVIGQVDTNCKQIDSSGGQIEVKYW